MTKYCEHCGVAIMKDNDGFFLTGCQHYPLDQHHHIRVKPDIELYPALSHKRKSAIRRY